MSVGGIELRSLDGESRLINGAKHIFQLARHQLFVKPGLQIRRHAGAFSACQIRSARAAHLLAIDTNRGVTVL
jgi:hypothetical protein